MTENIPKKSSDESYLERLQFDPRLRESWLNFFVVNFRVVLLIIAALTAWGVYSYQSLPRESNPEIKIPIAIVSTPYPGASPADVEELVTKKLETAISGLRGIKKVTSSSMNSVSSISVEFEAGEDVKDSIRTLRDKITDTRSKLPSEAKDPIVQEVSFDDQPILTMALTGPYDGLTLRKYADDIKKELEKIGDIREVRVSGGDETEFSIAYDANKLIAYGISLAQANQSVATANVTLPSGNIDNNGFTYSVRTDARMFDAETLGNIPLVSKQNGNSIYLKDVATVEERAIKRTVMSRISANGSVPQEAVTLSIVKRAGGSIINTVDQSKAIMDTSIAKLPSGISYEITTNLGNRIRKDFTQLGHDFSITVILVMVTLFALVGFKEALIAGLAIPLVFFATFGVMLLSGVSLNFLSLFSLLLALGLLVDDAIVVVSATKQYLRTGKFTPEEAVLLVLNDFKVVLTTTTLATVWAFLPLLLASGMMGQFLKSIPITVSVVLIASLLVALIINHPLAAVLERMRLTKNIFWSLIVTLVGAGALAFMQKNAIGYGIALVIFVLFIVLMLWYRRNVLVLIRNKQLVELEWRSDDAIKSKLREAGSHEDTSLGSRLMHGIVRFDRIIPVYEKYVRVIVFKKANRVRMLVATGIVFIAAVALPVVGIVQTEFFPVSDAEYIFVNITAPTGMQLSETNHIVEQVEKELMQHSEIVNFSTTIGQAGASQNRAGSTNGPSSNLASMVVTLKDEKERDVTSYDLAATMREHLSGIKEAKISVESQQSGPPSGASFEARVTGDDLQTLDSITKDLQVYLKDIPGVINIDSSLREAPADYTFTLDPQKLSAYGLNAAQVGSVLRTAISGTEISTVLKNNDEFKIIARFEDMQVANLDALGDLQVMNAQGKAIYLKDVATIELKPSINAITRIDQKRVVLLTAGVETSTKPAAVLAAFKDVVAKKYQLPSGYEIVYGGENEQNTESVMSILRALVIAMILIVVTMVVQFNSFRQSMIVLVTLPLALIGVFVGMALFQVPLSFPGLIGILALFGIVVKNAIILIDKMNLNIKSGMHFDEAIVDAGNSRIEAIIITSVCTILGIIPITLSNALWQALGSAVIFGLVFSSFLTLFIVPVLYYMLMKKKEIA